MQGPVKVTLENGSHMKRFLHLVAVPDQYYN
jgi:hypothetical protein